jgi:hypothetical protein
MPIVGETFRIGGQATRERGTVESIPHQKLATYSHIRFIKYMEQKGIDIDVIFFTYKTDDKELKALERWYNNYVIDKVYFDTLCNNDNHMLSIIADYLYKRNIDKYDYVFLMRFDFYIKEYFQDVLFRLNPEKIIFPFRDINGYKNNNDWLQVWYYGIIIPNRLYNYIYDGAFFLGHWSHTKCDFNDYEFLINTPHWCSSSLGYNPCFTNVGREDYNKYDWVNEKNKNFFAGNPYAYSQIYNDIINTDTLNENLQKYTFSNSLDDDIQITNGQ